MLPNKQKTIFVLLLAFLLPATALAHDFEVDGIYYSYQFIVNGTQESIEANVTYRGTSFTDYSDRYTGDIVIPSTVTHQGETYPVTGIDSYAFYGCSDLTSVSLPNSITTIGSLAFYGCSDLTGISLPSSITTIGIMAFFDCSSMTAVTIPNSVTSIGTNAFDGTAWYNNQPDGLVFAGAFVYKYKGAMPNGTHISINEGTLGIADDAFYCCTGLTSISIPNTVTCIGNSAFSNCTSLSDFEIHNSATIIGANAFQGTAWYDSQPDGLVYIGLDAYKYKGTVLDESNIVIRDGTIHISGQAFQNCNSMTSVTIPNSVTSIGQYAFQGCKALETLNFNAESCNDFNHVNCPFNNLNILTINIGDNVQRIPAHFAYNLAKLSNVNIGNSVKSIGGYAFSNCTGLSNVTIGDSVTAIGDFSFTNCNALADLSLPDKVVSIGKAAFMSCSSLTSLIIPNSVNSIGPHAFSSCSRMRSVAIGNSVTSMGFSAFADCTALETLYYNAVSCDFDNWGRFGNTNISTLIFGDSVKTIPDYFAWELDKLTNVTIGLSVTSIGNNAFSGCTALDTLNFNAVSCADFEYCPFKNLNISTINIGNDVERIPAYFAYSLIKLTDLTISKSVTTIGYYAFCGCNHLTNIDIPNSVKSIGNNAFFDCSGLTSITVERDNAYYDSRDNCNAIIETANNSIIVGCMNTIIPNSVTTIGYYAFYDCSGLTNITIPSSVISIGEGAFSACSALNNVTIGTSVTSIGDYAFQGCTALDTLNFNAVSCADFSSTASSGPFNHLYISTINIGDSVKRIPDYFVWQLDKLTNLNFGNSVTSIGKYSFNGCSSLKNVFIPNSVTSIGSYAFSGCSGLTSLTIGTAVSSIFYGAFSGCTALDTLNYNAISCADFSSSPFRSSNISAINIGGCVERIPAYFAHGLTRLARVNIPASVTSIGDYAFQGCTALDTLNFNAVSCADFSSTASSGPFNHLYISTINIGDSVKRIPDYFVWQLDKLTNLNFGNSVTSIGKYSFNGCSSLKNVFIPNSVTIIGSYAFSGCSGLTSLTIGTAVSSIFYGAFSGCTALDTLNYNAISCADFSSSPFRNSNISAINIGGCVERIPAYFAHGLPRLASVNIPASVTSIGDYAFQGCTALDTLYYNAVSCADFNSTASYRPFNNLNISIIYIGSDVERIPAYFAYGLTKLTDLTVGTSVTNFGDYSFYNCSKLTSVTSLRPEAVLLPYYTFSYSTYSNATLTVPVGSYNSYKQTNYWNRFYGINESTSVDSIALNYSELSLFIGETARLTATIIPDDANQQVTWSTNNSSIVSVESDGTVTGLEAGTATVFATAGDGSGRIASCRITVLANCRVYLDTLTHIRGEAAVLVEVPISFYNRNTISAIQFDVSLPGCASFGYPVMWVNESRLTNSHSFSYNKLSDKSYRVLIASPSSSVLNGNDGPLVYLNVMLSKGVNTAGDHYISVSNIIAAEPDETRHVLDEVNGVVRYYYIVGDVDADLSVDIADYMATASKILARSPSPFYSDAADVDENSSINVTDLVGITNISLGIKPITLRYMPRREMGLDLFTCEPLVIAAGLKRSITLNLEADFDFAAFQMDLSLPQGLTLVGAELGGDASGLQLTWATLPNGNVRLLSSSFSDVEVQGDCPGLLTLMVKAEDDFGGYHSCIGLSNITFAERNLASHEFDDMYVECYSSTAVNELSDATRIFVEEGHIIIETPVDGTVVISDISGHTREYPVFAGRNGITPWCNGVMMIRYNKRILKINLK